MRDMFDYYGTTQVERPWGTLTRYKLFDLPWEGEGARRDALVGQEEVQGELYRVLSNFAQEGRPNRLILLHGPNGSSKSTVAACLMRALEHYSSTDEGALYRFHWVFPSQKTIRGAIGFGGPKTASSAGRELRAPRRRSDRRAALHRDPRSSSFPAADRAAPAIARRALSEDRQHAQPPAGLALARPAFAQEPAGARGAARELQGVARRSAAPRAGRALLHLAALPRRRRHHRAADVGRRRRAANHRRSLGGRAPDVAQGDHALRSLRRAHRGRGRLARVQRSLEAPARRLQVPADLDRDGRGRAAAAERAAQLRHDRERQRGAPRARSASTPSSRASAAGSRWCARRICAATSKKRRSTTRRSRRKCSATSRRTPPRSRPCSPRSRACASRTPTATRARWRTVVSVAHRDREDGPLRLWHHARAARLRRAEAAQGQHRRDLPRERRLPHLRRAHRREPPRDADGAARCRAEQDLQVPLAARRA